jgi:hypothetical protein
MNGLQKILVVDNGERDPDCALSAELAGLGYSSVTAPVEAAEDVLAILPSPAAVVLQVPSTAGHSERARFLALADRLSRNLRSSGIPIIVLGTRSGDSGSILETELGHRVLAPDGLGNAR